MFLTVVSIFVISNHNSFRVLFDKLLSYILFEKKIYLYFSIGNGQPRDPALCDCIGTLLSPYRHLRFFCDLAYA